MEILAQTDSQLILQHKPVDSWKQGKTIVITGVMVSLLPLLQFILNENTGIKLSCNRSTESKINCTIERFYPTRTEILKISEPQAAKVVEKKYKGISYKVVIVTSMGEYSLFKLDSNNYDSDEQKNQLIANKINQFINSKDKILEIKEQNDEKYFASSLGFFFIVSLILISLGCITMTLPTTCCTLDKKLNKVTIERKGKRTQQRLEYSLNNILRFDIQPYGTQSRLMLVLISQQEILVDKYYISTTDDIKSLLENIKFFLETNMS